MRSAPAATPCARNDEPWIMAATVLGSSLAFIDGTVVSVALPVLQRDMNATLADLQWIVGAYTLSLAALMLVGGSLGDRLGHRRIFALGVGLFATASAACAFAPGATWLILARALQGVGGALLTPASLAILSAAFPEDRRGRAIGTWSGFTAITTALGPVLGGLFVEHLSWRWVFLINLPVAAAVIAIALWRVPESRDESAAPDLDWWGTVLATLGLGAAVYGLIESTNLGFDHPRVMMAIGAGVAGIGAFLFVEGRARNPMVPLGLFRSRTFTGANLLTFLLYGGLSASFFLLPFNLIQVQGYSSTAAGAALLPFVFMMFGLSRWSGGLVDRFGARAPLVIGPAVVAASALVYTLPGIGGSYWTTFFPAVALQGLGMAISVAPLTTVVLASVDAHRAGTASAINNSVSRIAGLVAVALVGIVALAAFNGQLDARLAGLNLPPDVVAAVDAQRTKLAAAELPPGLSADAAGALRRAIQESFVASFRLTALMAGALALAGGLTALGTIGEVRREHR